jgi:uncharacterized protein (TIGR02118 family)
MVKVMFFLYRRPDLDRDAFERYSREIHVPLVSRAPGLRRYVVSHALPGGVIPSDARDACDAVAELWFDSVDAFQQAIASPEGAAALADQANYLDLTRTYALLGDEHVVR